MKYLPSTILIGLLTFTLAAQTPPAPAGDPFVKNAEGAPAKGNEPDSWVNCVIVFEAYALDKNDAATLIESEPASGARYRRVLELVKMGKAREEVLSALTTKSGQRAVIEAIDEVRYAKAFGNPVNTRGIAFPYEWETRNVGDTFELEPVIPPNGHSCDINLVPQRVRLAEFRDIPGAEGDSPTSHPLFTTQKITTSVYLPENEPYYLGTFTPPTVKGALAGAAGSEVWLSFLHVSLVGAEEKVPAKPVPNGVVNFEYSYYSLDRALAREILVAPASVNAPWEKLQALLAQKKAALEHVATLKTKAGQRTVTDEVEEVPYTTEYVPESRVSAANSDRVAGYASTFETRNAGFTVEVEPVISPKGGIVDVNQVVQSVKDLGNLKTTGVALSYPAQPVFQTSKVTTSLSVPVGQHVLISTFNPPEADGVNDQVDDGRTWLLFVRATVGEP